MDKDRQWVGEVGILMNTCTYNGCVGLVEEGGYINEYMYINYSGLDW